MVYDVRVTCLMAPWCAATAAATVAMLTITCVVVADDNNNKHFVGNYSTPQCYNAFSIVGTTPPQISPSLQGIRAATQYAFSLVHSSLRPKRHVSRASRFSTAHTESPNSLQWGGAYPPPEKLLFPLRSSGGG